MNEHKRDVPKCITLLRRACERHQMLYRDAMCGRGVDRHLFGLFVICKGLGQVSTLFRIAVNFSLSKRDCCIVRHLSEMGDKWYHAKAD